tara:strand:- start:4592 stop:6472 length:1881 start_codon:yes stop_codon:yes gene_type:complete
MATVEKTIVIKTDTKSSQKEVKELEKAVEGVNKEVKETATSSSELTGQLDNLTGGAISKFKAFKTSLKGVTGGFKTMKVAIASTGIGLLIIAISSLIAAFKGSEEGQNKFSKLTTVIGAAVGNLVDLLADLGEGIIDAFLNPVETIKGFADTIKTFITDKINGAIEGFGLLGSAIKKTFTGDFSGALEDAKSGIIKLNDNLNVATMARKALTKATTEFVKEQKIELAQAASVADMRAKADKIERKLIVDRSKLESEIANLRLKSRQEEEFSAAERKQALLDAQVLEDQLLDKETEFLELRRDAQILENTFSRSNKENLTKEAEAIAAVNRQQASRANTARQVQREVNTISKQIEAENKSKATQEKAEAKELADFKKILRDAEAVSEQEKRDLELIKIQEHYDNLILQAEENNIKTDELEAARDEAKRLKQKEFDDKDLATKKANTEAEINLDKKKIQSKQQALDAIVSIAGAETGVGRALLFAKQALALKETLMDIKKITFKGTQAVAGAGVDAAQNVSESSKIGFPQNIVTIAAAIGQGLSIISSVKKAVKKTKANVATSAEAPSAPSTPSIPPSFNIVGASDTNQLADAIGGQTQQPIQAFVVANDVTTAQSLENNIVEGATLG